MDSGKSWYRRRWATSETFSEVNRPALPMVLCLQGAPARLNRPKLIRMDTGGLLSSECAGKCVASQHLATDHGSLGLWCHPSLSPWKRPRKAFTVVMSSGAVLRSFDPLAERCSCWFQVGLVYMFNLIVGTGALTMPKAFATAGWLVSLVLLVFVGFMR